MVILVPRENQRLRRLSIHNYGSKKSLCRRLDADKYTGGNQEKLLKYKEIEVPSKDTPHELKNSFQKALTVLKNTFSEIWREQLELLLGALSLFIRKKRNVRSPSLKILRLTVESFPEAQSEKQKFEEHHGSLLCQHRFIGVQRSPEYT